MSSPSLFMDEQLRRDEAEARRLHAHEERKALRRAERKAAQDDGRDVLKGHRDEVPPFLAKQGFNTVRLEANPCAEPGQPLYERFLEAWTDTNMNVRLCFHGTPETNIQAILRDGLDPKRRSGQALGVGEYFGATASVSLPYCRGGKRMIVFAVLTDPSGVTVANESVVVVHKVEHQLPIFSWTFSVRATHAFAPRVPAPVPPRLPPPPRFTQLPRKKRGRRHL